MVEGGATPSQHYSSKWGHFRLAHSRFHPCVDEVAHDLVRVQVLDRAEIQLSFGVGVLADTGQPHSVRRVGGEPVGGAAVVIDLARRSSWTGGPALRFSPRFLACSDHSRWVEQSRQTRLFEA